MEDRKTDLTGSLPEVDALLWHTGFGGYVIYWCYDASGRLLYVGSTNNIRVRLNNHIHHQPWGQEIARVEVSEERYNVNSVHPAERQAIIKGKPLHNKTLP